MNETREDIIKYLSKYYTKKELEDVNTEVLYMLKKTLERNLL